MRLRLSWHIEKNTWGWPASWTDIDKLSTKRIEVTETGEKSDKSKVISG